MKKAIQSNFYDRNVWAAKRLVDSEFSSKKTSTGGKVVLNDKLYEISMKLIRVKNTETPIEVIVIEE